MKSILIAALLAAPAQKTAPPCLTQAQVEDITLFALPPLLEAMASRCGPSLPANAYLLNGGRALAEQLGAESASRWAGASAALSVVAKEKFPESLSEPTARGLVRDLAANELLKKATPEDCARIDHLADLLSPLPPRNLAGIVVTFAEIMSKDEKRSKSRPFICPATRP
ncbi:MAG: hypothetical protein ACXW27_03630 [Allosphingosinicella sp.]